MLSVEEVVRSNLCLGCGACANLPEVAMELNERGFARPIRPQIAQSAPQPELEAICSGYSVEQDAADRPYDDVWGPILDIWTGNSTDAEVRYRGSSGGVLSQIAIYLVESKAVDFVVHTRADPDEPLGNVTIPSFDREEILAGAGSRYAPSSPLAKLNAYLETGKKFVFIGKPCDVVALRRMARIDPRIDAQVPYMLSFFCAGVPSRFGALAVLKKLEVEAAEVSKFEFRGRGWPGLTRATRFDGSEATMDYNSSWGTVLSRNLQFRCKICPDGTGEFADIVCADAWYGKDGYPDFEERDGRSLVIVRTGRGQALLAELAQKALIELEPLHVSEIELMQPYQRDRKRAVLARLGALAVGRRKLPNYRNLRLSALAWSSNPLWLLKNALGTFRRLPSTPPGS
jgi:coenzyme F420 hydrogenase subunit beta